MLDLDKVTDKACHELYECDKLIIATGIHSKTKWPDIDSSRFQGLTLHSKDVGELYSHLMVLTLTTVAVVGGNKSAVDVVNACALDGRTVSWIVRPGDSSAGLL